MPFGMSWSALGKKAVGVIDRGVHLGQKVAHATEGIAHKVSSITGALGTGAAALGGMVPVLAPVLEPAAAGLGAIAGASKAVELGARGIGAGLDKAEAVTGAVRSGIERVRKIGSGNTSLSQKLQSAQGLAGDFRSIKANLPQRRRRP